MADAIDHEQFITATFDDPESADKAANVVANRSGYNSDEVTVLMSDETREEYYSDEDVEIEEGNKAAEGAGIGGATGGTVGGIVGALMAAGGAVLLPGIGLAISGPLAAAMAGAGAGGAAGSIVGALVGAGIPEERAKRYKKDINQGRVVLGVQARTKADAREIVDEWKGLGAHHIHTGTYALEKPAR